MEQNPFYIKEVLSVLALAVSGGALYMSFKSYGVSSKSYGVSLKSYEDTYVHKRLETTLALIRDWDEKTLDSRVAVSNFHDTYTKSLTPIPVERIDAKRAAELKSIAEGKLPAGTPLITDHMASILNFMETFAVAVNMGVVEEKYLRATYGQTFQRWAVMLREFRKKYDKAEVREHNPWHQLSGLLERWKVKPETPAEEKQTGSL